VLESPEIIKIMMKGKMIGNSAIKRPYFVSRSHAPKNQIPIGIKKTLNTITK
jgi:hypothetical protein